MLKVTLLFEAHDPLAQARIAELEAERDEMERDAKNGPSPLLDLAKMTLQQAMTDPAKFKEFLALFQGKRKDFLPLSLGSVTRTSSVVSAAKSDTPAGTAAGTPAGTSTGGTSTGGTSTGGTATGGTAATEAPNTDSDTSCGSGSDTSNSDGEPPVQQFADGWIWMDKGAFARHTPYWSWRPSPKTIVARVEPVGGAVPIVFESGAEIYVWSVLVKDELRMQGASCSAEDAAEQADKHLRAAGWVLVKGYDYDVFRMNRDPIASVFVDEESPDPTGTPAAYPMKARAKARKTNTEGIE